MHDLVHNIPSLRLERSGIDRLWVQRLAPCAWRNDHHGSPRRLPTLQVWPFWIERVMSGKYMDAVFGLDIPQHQQWVLMALASYADPHGGYACPSIAKLSLKTDKQRRQIQVVLRELEADGLITPTQHRQGGRGRATEYRLDFRRAKLKSGYEIRDGLPQLAPEPGAVQAPTLSAEGRGVERPLKGQKGAGRSTPFPAQGCCSACTHSTPLGAPFGDEPPVENSPKGACQSAPESYKTNTERQEAPPIIPPQGEACEDPPDAGSTSRQDRQAPTREVLTRIAELSGADYSASPQAARLIEAGVATYGAHAILAYLDWVGNPVSGLPFYDQRGRRSSSWRSVTTPRSLFNPRYLDQRIPRVVAWLHAGRSSPQDASDRALQDWLNDQGEEAIDATYRAMGDDDETTGQNGVCRPVPGARRRLSPGAYDRLEDEG